MDEQRKQIWIALSNLYLDTELQDYTMNHMVGVFQESTFTYQEIREIDRYEVFPLLQQNMFGVAGVWGAFEPEWLVKQCTRQQQKRKSAWHRGYCNFYYFLFGKMHKELWGEIKKGWISKPTIRVGYVKFDNDTKQERNR